MGTVAVVRVDGESATVEVWTGKRCMRLTLAARLVTDALVRGLKAQLVRAA